MTGREAPAADHAEDGAAATHVRRLVGEAVAHHRAGRLTDARRLYEQILEAAESPQVRCNLATILRAKGQHDAAAAAYRQALALKPDFAEAHGGLGNILRDLGRFDEAIACYQVALGLNPARPEFLINLGNIFHGTGRLEDARDCFERALAVRPDDEEARFTLAALKGENRTRPPPSYAINLFNGYVNCFEEHVVGALGYDVPRRLRRLLNQLVDERKIATPEGGWSLLDLGCGSGLCGVEFRDRCRHMIGIDIAPRMIELVRQRGIYHESDALTAETALDRYSGRIDIAVAADVFIYVGELEAIFAAAGRALPAGGLLLFSTEISPSEDVLLRPSVRFAHARGYIERLAEANGLAVLRRTETVLRTDHGQPIAGDLWALRRSAT